MWVKFTGKKYTRSWEIQRSSHPSTLCFYRGWRTGVFFQWENLLGVLLSTSPNPAVVWPAPRPPRAHSLNGLSSAAIAGDSPTFRNTQIIWTPTVDIHSEREKKRVEGTAARSDMSPMGLIMISDALNPLAAAAQQERLHICRAEVGWKLQTSCGINPRKIPPRKSTFHIASAGWNNNFNLNPAEPQRFLVVVKAIKKNKLITSGFKLTTQWAPATGRHVGAQVRKDWEVCTRWWHLMAACSGRPPPPSPCGVSLSTGPSGSGGVSLSQTETSLRSFQKIWFLLGYQPISTSSTSPTFLTQIPAMLLPN